MHPELVIRTPDGKSASIALNSDRFSLGRASANELHFPEDAGLSRQHLVIERNGDVWSVRDLESKNGTLVNAVRISGVHPLAQGDRISAGHLTLEFNDLSNPVKAQTVVFIEPNAGDPAESTTVISLQGALGPDMNEDPGKTRIFQGSPQMRALIRAGRELAYHRPLAELFEVIMDLSVEAVGAARGVLMTVEGDHLQVRAARGGGFQISSTVRDRVLKEKASLLVRDAQLDHAFREHLSIVEHKVRSMIAVPLQTNDRVIGLIYLDTSSMVRAFSREDLNLLTVMANVAAIRIENARLAEVEQAERLLAKELDQAASIQRKLLPTAAPRLPGLDIAGYNASCHTVGGDYYDFIEFPDGRVAILVGDVAGKGMPAALMMSSLQARVQVLFEDPDNLAKKVARLNRVVSANCPDNRFITFFICILDPKNGEIVYCNAGHNPPLLVRRNGDVEPLTKGGLILGILGNAPYVEDTCRMDPGDLVVLFSDGVTEAFHPDTQDEFGEDRLVEVMKACHHYSSEQIIAETNRAVAQWTAGSPPSDDITLVVARRN